MSQPEISHRCPSCGASIRDFGERAMFCPECGKPLAVTTEPSTSVQTPAASVEELAGYKAGEESLSATAVKGDEGKRREMQDEAATATRGERHGAREKTRETLHRASSAARGAIEHNVKRVEKVQHVSAVVLEEASSDPSLRFVLVALGLFVVFVILLVVSKVMG